MTLRKIFLFEHARLRVEADGKVFVLVGDVNGKERQNMNKKKQKRRS